MRKALQIIVLGTIVFLTSCGAPRQKAPGFSLGTLDERPKDLFLAASNVDPSDGIDAEEGRALAWIYFLRVYGGCGACLPIEDRGTNWYFPCAVGFAGANKPGILVSKTSLRISCASGPDISNLDHLLNAKDPVWRETKSYKYQSSN